MNLFLIGYRGTGKTSVGRLLSGKLQWPFMDTDVEVEHIGHKKISEIVEAHGWSAFRKIEREVIKKMCARNRQVVATGGGAVLDRNNVEDMKRTGILIWLKASPHTIKRRITNDFRTQTMRPSLTGNGVFEEIEAMLRLRHPYYEKAGHFSVETDCQQEDDLCGLILEKLKIFNIK